MTSTQTIEELSAQYAAKYGITREMIDHAERWTETDGDLEGLSEERVRGILDMRFGAIAVDTPRSELWHTPDTIDVIEDIPYLPDGGYDTEAGQCRGHLLDLYLPHDAVLRCGHTLPVYIDIHGGGFTYGYKELNRNFNVHLAETGFAVFSLNYRPAPQTDLRGQLADVQAALRWIKAHLTDYPVNPNAVFLTGDSAGGALTMLTLAIENNAEAAAAFGVDEPSGIGFAGAAPVCGAYSSASLETMGSELTVATIRIAAPDSNRCWASNSSTASKPPTRSSSPPKPGVQRQPAATVHRDLRRRFPRGRQSGACCRTGPQGADFELFDPKPRRHETLGHVFVIGMPWLDESVECFERLRRFSYERC